MFPNTSRFQQRRRRTATTTTEALLKYRNNIFEIEGYPYNSRIVYPQFHKHNGNENRRSKCHGTSHLGDDTEIASASRQRKMMQEEGWQEQR